MVKDPSSAVSVAVYRTRDKRNALAAANDRALNGAVHSAALALTPQQVERKDGKTGSRRALRTRAGSRRGRRGRPVLQEPFWERLILNVGIVPVFAAFYLRFLKRP